MLFVVRGLYRLAQIYKGRERSRQRTEVRPENLFGVCAVPFVCLFLLNFARVSKCLFWYAVNRQISLWCMIQYPCSKHTSSPSLPHQAMLVYTCLLFIHSQCTILDKRKPILESGKKVFITKCLNSFVQDCRWALTPCCLTSCVCYIGLFTQN